MPWIMSGIQAAGELCRKSIVGIKHVWLKKRIYKIYKIYAHESRWRNHQLTYHLLISFVSQKGGVVCFFCMEKWIHKKRASCFGLERHISFLLHLPCSRDFTGLSPEALGHIFVCNFRPMSKHYAVCFLQNLRVTSKYFKFQNFHHFHDYSTTLQYCHHFGFSTLETLQKIKVWWTVWVASLLLLSDSISIVYTDITRGQCLRFSSSNWWGMIGKTMQNACGVCIKSQFRRQLALSWSAANPFQSSPWLKAHGISWWLPFPPWNEQQIGIENICTNWNQSDKAIKIIFFVWETFKDFVTKISAAALSVTERSRSRHSLLNRGPTTSRASTAKKIPDIQLTKRILGCQWLS